MLNLPANLNVESSSRLCECFDLEIKFDKAFLPRHGTISSETITSHFSNTSWQIVVNVENHYEGTYLNSLSLKRTDISQYRVKATLSFEIQNLRGACYKESFERTFLQVKPADFQCGTARSFEIAYCRLKPGSGFKVSDHGNIIKGNLLVQDFCQKDKIENERGSPKKTTELQCNLKNSSQNNLFSDVIFSFGDDILYTHKMILSARSPVFKKMFQQNMNEANFNRVEITDIEKSVFDAFLIFLYTGVVENHKFDTVLSLYSTADKYEVTTLFNTCSNILVSYISEETALIILKSADMHSDAHLKGKAVQFMCENFTKVGETSDWKNLLDTDPHLASYTLRVVSSSVAAKERTIYERLTV